MLAGAARRSSKRSGKAARTSYLVVRMQAFETRPPALVTGPDGIVRVAGTRVSLETIVAAFDVGATAEEIAQQYPSVDLGSVYAVISLVLGHRGDVDAYVLRRRTETAEMKDAIEAAFPSAGIRARLLARRAHPGAV